MNTQRRRPPVELHRLIHAVVQNPETARALRETPEVVYKAFGVPPDQQAKLTADPRQALQELGVHPNLQFKYLGARRLLSLEPASILPFLEEGS